VNVEPDETIRVRIDDVVQCRFSLLGTHTIDLDRGVVRFRRFHSDGREDTLEMPVEEALDMGPKVAVTDDEKLGARFMARRLGVSEFDLG
jgi:hypothetical protein